MECSDIIFVLIYEILQRTEPIVYGFKNESASLVSDIVKRRKNERTEVIGRAFIAREMTIDLKTELTNKLKFLEEFQQLELQSGNTTVDIVSKIRFLIRRL